MTTKTHFETSTATDFLNALRNNVDLQLCLNDDQEVIVNKIHISVGPGNKVTDERCDIVYPSTGFCDEVPLYRIKAFRYNFKEGDYVRCKNGEMAIIGQINSYSIGLHAVLNDDGITIMNGNNTDRGKWVLGMCMPCNSWEKRAIDNELLSIGKRFNKETKQMEDVQCTLRRT